MTILTLPHDDLIGGALLISSIPPFACISANPQVQFLHAFRFFGSSPGVGASQTKKWGPGEKESRDVDCYITRSCGPFIILGLE
jgi:hypothetical protein